ncbi:MAG: hypothetical protein ACP5P0_00535 [Hydrogenobacter sp.]
MSILSFPPISSGWQIEVIYARRLRTGKASIREGDEKGKGKKREATTNDNTGLK